MDDLCNQFHLLGAGALAPAWVYSDYNIWAARDIPPGTYLGDVEGDRLYVDDLACDLYTHGLVFLDTDRVIDGRSCPLAYMAEEGELEDANCELYIDEATGVVGFVTMQWIRQGERLAFWNCAHAR